MIRLNKENYLENGVKLDEEDVYLLNNNIFYIGTKGYIVTGKGLYIHRLIMNTPKGMETDHINHDKLDNRKSNLRIVTRSENHSNMPKRANKSSIYKGVTYSKKYKKYYVMVTKYRKLVYYSSFDNEKEAALAYNIEAKKAWGDFACLNII